MKGIIFNLFEDVVTESFGPAAWDGLLCATGTEGVYASLGSYPDSELLALVDATAAITGRSRQEVLRGFGEAVFPLFIARYPNFMSGARDARTFLLSLNTTIHSEVRKLYSGAGCPHFRFAIAPNRLRIGYGSPRRLCSLAEGMIQGVATHFGERIELSHPECMHKGAQSCRIDVTWPA